MRRRPRATVSGRHEAARLIAVVLGLQVLFFALLVVSQALPDRIIVSQLAQSVRDGAYGPASLPDRMGGISDSFTECVAVGTGMGPAPGENVFHQAGRMPRLSNCVKGTDQILALDAGEAVQDSSYFKYWAGYSVITRPTIAVAGVEGLRILTGAVLALGLCYAGVALMRVTRWWVPVTLLGPLLLASNLMSTPSTSLLSALTWGATLIGVGATAAAAHRSEQAAYVAVAVSAAVYCYLDLLSNPAAAWTLTAATATLVRWWVTRDIVVTRRVAVLSLMVWIGSFTITWVARWVWAVLFLGPSEVVRTVRENVAFRTGGEWTNVDPGFGQGLVRNVSWWLSRVPTSGVVLVLSVALIVAAVFVAIRRGRGHLAVTATLAACALPVVVWFLLVSNHSQIHAFFTYRLIPAALGAVLAGAVCGAWGPSVAEDPPHGRGGAP